MTVFFVPEKLVRKEDLVAFRAEARKIIPKKLKRLCESPNHFTLQIFGLLAGYFIVGTGHRTGVLTNMTVDEVMAAESSNGNILIEVTHHKSAGTYGYAQLSMPKEEYEWFTTLLELRSRFEGANSPFFFFTASGGKLVKILLLFQQEWRRMGFPPIENQHGPSYKEPADSEEEEDPESNVPLRRSCKQILCAFQRPTGGCRGGRSAALCNCGVA
ncbi:uncharacterized protein [Hoplias malabaricus]|uniref:uncharacterized protein isoform X1 n=1 Tax=Hoplias malabaricus TaxID=27720 RepID=UPI0034636006